MLGFWTIGKATGVGVVAALAALILWPTYAAYPAVRLPYLLALAVCAICGVSILLITLVDVALHQRSGRMRPIRAFDLVLALALAGPALAAVHALLS